MYKLKVTDQKIVNCSSSLSKINICIGKIIKNKRNQFIEQCRKNILDVRGVQSRDVLSILKAKIKNCLLKIFIFLLITTIF